MCGGRRAGVLLGLQRNGGGLGNNSTTDSTVPVPVDTGGVLAGKTVTAITAGGNTRVRWPTAGLLLGPQRQRAVGEQQHDRLEACRCAVDTGGGLNDKTVTAISAGGYARVRWPTGRPTAGATTAGELGNDSNTGSMVPGRWIGGVLA